MLNNIVDNLEQCGQHNIVQCCFHQVKTGCAFFAVYVVHYGLCLTWPVFYMACLKWPRAQTVVLQLSTAVGGTCLTMHTNQILI